MSPADDRRCRRLLFFFSPPPFPSFSAARIFTVDDALNINGDAGVVVTSPRIDIAGDLYFTSPTEGEVKLQDVPKQISDANAQIAEVRR